MKTSKYFLKFLFFFLLIAIYGCQKDLPKTLPEVSTNVISNITSTSATSGGTIIFDGNSIVSSRGICWSRNENPTISDQKTSDGSGEGTYSSSITELSPGKLYYVRAYATNEVGTAYGSQLTLTTTPILSTITTNVISEVTSSSAKSGGNITDDGGSTVIARGVCWDVLQNPTISSSKTSDGTGLGEFSSTISSLSAGTQYYVRAYATNGMGTAYGNELSFTTPKIAATVTTADITSITATSAVSGGTIADNGGGTITAKGVCWGIGQNPTITDSRTSDVEILNSNPFKLKDTVATVGFFLLNAPGGSFVSNITGLSPGITYYVRAYAINDISTSYGEQKSFSTPIQPVSITTTAATSLTSNSAISGGNISSDGGSPVTVRGVCWSTNQYPTITDNHTSDGAGTGTFTSNISGLNPGTTYYIRSYGTNGTGTSYGNQVVITTIIIPPIVTTSLITDITLNTAKSGGNVTSDGGSSVTARGVCWSTSQNPTIADNKTSDGSGTGTFTSSITGLISSTTYYVRSFATNSVGTGYGSQLMFITSSKITEENIIASVGATLTTSESVQLIIPANALPNNGIVSVGRTGNEPKSVPNQTLTVVGDPISIRLPSKEILKPLQLSFPAPTESIDLSTYNIFVYDGSTYLPLDYNISGGTVIVSIDAINLETTNVLTKSLIPSTNLIIFGINKFQLPNNMEKEMGLQEATIQSGGIQLNPIPINQVSSSSRILLLIHGWGGWPSTWEDFLNKIYTYNDFPSYTNYWTFGYNSSLGISENGQILSNLLQSYSKGASIDIVAHSMGGLVARSLIEQHNGQQYINKLVTLGTPHQGSPLAALRYVLGFFVSNPVDFIVYSNNTQGFKDLYTGSNFINQMMALSNPPLPYYTIACTNNSTFITSSLISGDDDGIVSVASAHGVNGADRPNYDVNIPVGLAHMEMRGNDIIYNQVMHYLQGQEPSVTTSQITIFNSTSATVGGNVTSDGGSTVTERGIYWSTNPLILGTKLQIGTGTGLFSTTLTGLTSNTTYYIKAYAINSQGTGYGTQVSFTTGVLPVAAFTGTPTTINTGQSVQFTDQSTNSPTSWNWSFGDGSTSTLQNPSHTYTTEGTYNVSLTATNGFGPNTLIKTSYITVNTELPTVTDIDGNVYKTVIIGTQTWMAENLKTTRYSNGDLIGTTTPSTLDIYVENAPKYQWAYDGDESNFTTYGRLYTWYTGADSRGLCPYGWHIPNETDWTELTTYLGGESVAGDKLKETGTDHWKSPNSGATNSSGFSALPGGIRSGDGPFFGISEYGFWWSSTESSTGSAWYRSIYYLYSSASNYSASYNKAHGMSVRCVKGEILNIPTVTTNSISNITSTSATSGGNVASDGGSVITARGVCWSTSQNPTISNSKTTDGTGTGSFTSSLTSLTQNTTYYLRAYATNSVGTAYGNEVSFTTTLSNGIIFNPNLTYGSVSDIDGNVYKTIEIGTQTWMAENLKVTKYNNGDVIPTTKKIDEFISPYKYQWPCNMDENELFVYGRLYTGYVLQDTRNVCPNGWHVPTVEEWQTLGYFVGGIYESSGGNGMVGAGAHLKEVGTLHWVEPNSDVTNKYGLTALPGGWIYNLNSEQKGFYGSYYTSTTSYWNGHKHHVDFRNDSGTLRVPIPATTQGHNDLVARSIRCVKD